MEMSDKELFEKNGYLFIPDVIMDPDNLYTPPPRSDDGERLTGQQKWVRKNKIHIEPEESQVKGSLARYNHPDYRSIHYNLRKVIENTLGMDLFPTYYYDRFYYVGQELTRHRDRPSCEISATLQISTNRDEQWPIWFELPDKSESNICMNNGDMVIYKGCEREHWREPLQSKYNKVKRLWKRIRKDEDDTYHHQIFFHYVNAQGPYVHYAFDKGT